MKCSFHRPINAVQFRQRIQQTLNYAAWGLFLAALVVLVSPPLAGIIFCVSILLGMLRSFPFSAAARLIDRHYHLKDRILTATALLRRKDRTPMEQLQIDDTADHLPIIQPRAVSPIRLPKMFWFAAGVFALDLAALVIIHGDFFPSAEKIEPVVQVLSVENPALLEEIIEKTEEIVVQHVGERSLQKLSEQLEMLWEKFDLKTMDIKESLATLSAMEEAFQTALDSLQLETMEESLQELAKTLELAEKTVPISRSLEKGDYSQAALELKKLDPEMLESLSQPERKAMAEQMQTLADHAEKRNQQPLQETAQKMSDALENSDDEQYQSATDALANEVEKHGIRQNIAKDLAKQQMALGMIKAESGEGNMSGGKGTDKSAQASQTWGSGAAGNPNAGKETDLQGQRQQETLTGTLGEQGESLTETVETQEMTAAKSRLQYREQYQQYRRLSEAVLDVEPIPLGQRQMIRRYFESIRPSGE
jgi:hypothetical protein